jgi:epsin
VRQRAKEIANLLEDEERLRTERQNRANMRERIQGSRYDTTMPEPVERSVPTPGQYNDDESELQKALEASARERERQLKER